MSYIMVIDLKRCVGCNACATICKAENGTRPGVMRSKVMRKEIGKYPDVRRISVPLLCMHCDNPPCVDVCPTGATYKREEDGIVVIDKDICVGCLACITACPYGARYNTTSTLGYFGDVLTPYEEVKYADMPVGVTDKCDFCFSSGRLERGEKPACVENCITGARFFGTREEMADLIAERKGFQLRSELGLDPKVYYLP